ncbi:MAG: serine acetyltransferase [Acidobacteriaceae bacterium]
MSKFSADIERYKSKGHHGKALWLDPVIWAIAFYRLRNWVNVTRVPWIVRIPVVVFCFVPNRFCEAFFAMGISPGASIGEGLYIGHIGGVIISPQAVIGKNCDISHRVTIGSSAMGRKGSPILGDDIYVGTGSTLVGKIKIGSGAKIAANTLVIDDVPEGATVMGVPGRILFAPSKIPQPTSAATSESTDPSEIGA